jgi:hypothetical protein
VNLVDMQCNEVKGRDVVICDASTKVEGSQLVKGMCVKIIM